MIAVSVAICGPLAQWLERRPHKPGVTGSSPVWPNTGGDMPSTAYKERIKNNTKITIIDNNPCISFYSFSLKVGIDQRLINKHCINTDNIDLKINLIEGPRSSKYITIDEVERFVKVIKPKLLKYTRNRSGNNKSKAIIPYKKSGTYYNQKIFNDRPFVSMDDLSYGQYLKHIGIRIT